MCRTSNYNCICPSIELILETTKENEKFLIIVVLFYSVVVAAVIIELVVR